MVTVRKGIRAHIAHPATRESSGLNDRILGLLDIAEAGSVVVEVDHKRAVVYVHINGITRLRATRCNLIEVEEQK